MRMPVVVVFSTFPTEGKAAEVAQALVGERLAACVNLVPRIRSIYRWEGKICDEAETLAVIKTTAERAGTLTARLVELHPYDVPEAIVLPVDGGHAPYLAWVTESVRR